MLFKSRGQLLAGAAALLLLINPVHAEIPNKTIKLGVLTDLSGFAADSTGPGSVVAAKLAIEDFKAEKPDLTVELIQAESKGPWDFYKLVETIPAKEAFRPIEEGNCPMVKK